MSDIEEKEKGPKKMLNFSALIVWLKFRKSLKNERIIKMKSQPNPTPPPGRDELRKQLTEDFLGLQSDYHNAGHSIPDSYLNSFLEGGYRGAELMERHLETQRTAELGRDWISVEERLPVEGELVLTAYGKNIVDTARWYMKTYNVWKDEGKKPVWFEKDGRDELDLVVTHWQPLPSPPSTQAKAGEGK